MKIRPLFLLFLVCCTGPAWSFEPFVIKDIRVEGIQRTEAGTVFSYMPVKTGDTLNDEKAADPYQALSSSPPHEQTGRLADHKRRSAVHQFGIASQNWYEVHQS